MAGCGDMNIHQNLTTTLGSISFCVLQGKHNTLGCLHNITEDTSFTRFVGVPLTIAVADIPYTIDWDVVALEESLYSHEPHSTVFVDNPVSVQTSA